MILRESVGIMDLKLILGKIKDFFFSMANSFLNSVINPVNKFILVARNKFLEEKSKSKNWKIIICIGISILVFCIFIAIIANFNKNRQTDKKTNNIEKKYSQIIIPHPLEKPEEPSLPDDYYLSRPRTEKMTEQDIEKWFTIPDDSMFDQLNQKNNEIIKNILEDAP